MNKAIIAALVGVLGLALGFGAGWVWDEFSGDDGANSTGTESPATSTSPSPAASS
jgi:hypothetical protein